MAQAPEYHLRAEIRRILRARPPPPEVLLRVRGAGFDRDRPETFLHVRAIDRREKVRTLGVGREVKALLLVTARFIEERERPARSLAVDGHPGAVRSRNAIRVVGYDTLVTGRVLRQLDEETIALDAGIPLLVRLPGPTELPAPDEHVEFLIHEPILAELF